MPAEPLHFPVPLTLVCVDDNALFTHALVSWVRRRAGWQMLATFNGGEGVAEFARVHRPRVVLMDLDMPGVDTCALVRSVLAAAPGTTVVMLSGRVEPRDVMACLDSGASGYIAKDNELEEIAELVERAASGSFVFCPLSASALHRG